MPAEVPHPRPQCAGLLYERTFRRERSHEYTEGGQLHTRAASPVVADTGGLSRHPTLRLIPPVCQSGRRDERAHHGIAGSLLLDVYVVFLTHTTRCSTRSSTSSRTSASRSWRIRVSQGSGKEPCQVPRKTGIPVTTWQSARIANGDAPGLCDCHASRMCQSWWRTSRGESSRTCRSSAAASLFLRPPCLVARPLILSGNGARTTSGC